MKHRALFALSGLVAVSFVVRTALAWLRSVPALFPDEYIYSSIGRSIAESGRPLIRGGSAHFPALLQPIVTAPAWLIGDVDTAFRVVQAIGALAMSLSAIPVYLHRPAARSEPADLAGARRLHATRARTCCTRRSCPPSRWRTRFLLVCVYAAVRALAEPSRRSQVLFIAAACLTTLARIQFAVLPVVFVLAAIVVGVRERRGERRRTRTGASARGSSRWQPSPWSLPVPRGAWIYRYLFGFHAGPLGILHWASLDAMTLAYAAGWIIVPGALLGLWLALARPRTTEELAFGAITVLLAAALFLEAGLLQASLEAGREIQERYVFYAAPLLAISFAIYAGPRLAARLPHLVLAARLVLMSVRLPLSGYAVVSTLNGSPILFGVYWLTGRLGTAGDASALVAAAVPADDARSPCWARDARGWGRRSYSAWPCSRQAPPRPVQ